MTPADVQEILAELGKAFDSDLLAAWNAAADLPSDQFRAFVIDAFPELVLPYSSAAAEIGAQWYDSLPSATDYQATVGELPPEARLTESAVWALNVGAGERAISLLSGAGQRGLVDGLRETVFENVIAEPGARWARHASANACGFCRMLATRGAVYRSEESARRVVGRSVDLEISDRRAIALGQMTRDEALERRSVYRSQRQATKHGKTVGDKRGGQQRGTQALGDRFHDHCHCVPVMVRPGQSYEPAPYTEQWEQDYIRAVSEARRDGKTLGKYGAIDVNEIVRRMDLMHA